MAPHMNFRPTPSKTYQLTHAVNVGKSGGALQGSWDVPSAHSIDRTSSQKSVTDQFEAATTIQRIARGHGTRDVVFKPGATHKEVAEYMKAHQPQATAPGMASGNFDDRDKYAVSPYGMGYDFVNNPHDQFGSNKGFNQSTTSAMSDPKPTPQMRVKSGYTGHVPKGRDHIGSTYRTHDNRGSAGKTMVPIPTKDAAPPNDEYLAKMKRNMTYYAGQSKTFYGRMDAHNDTQQNDGGALNLSDFGQSVSDTSTVKVPDRITKLMEHEDMKGPDGTMATADIGDEHDSKYLKGGQNPMAGYTGHVPRAKEVIGSTVYGPTIGISYHGPAMEADPAGFVRPSSPNKVAECP